MNDDVLREALKTIANVGSDEAQRVALVLEAVVQAPCRGAALDGQQQKKSVAVAQPAARITRLDGADGGV